MKFDVIIVGAGIVGLATGIKLLEAKPGLKVLILEKEEEAALHQSSHNSGVIHSGIYYRPGSLKAKNCIDGYGKLLEFCDQHQIKYEICGKMIVATNEEEIPRLRELFLRGEKNGLKGLKTITADEIKEIEPHAAGLEAILVPQTGIVDFKALARKYEEILLRQGAEIKYGRAVDDIWMEGASVAVDAAGERYTAKTLVSCAGLFSDRVARKTNPDLQLRILPFRGEYYILKKEKRHLVRGLIYPVPDPEFPFLGVHFTRMIDGNVEAGPNAVLALKREGYLKTDFNISDIMEILAWPGFRKIARRYWRQGFGEIHRSLSKKAFVTEIQRLVPEITADDLEPGGAGVRAQACHRDGSLLDDFFIEEGNNLLHVCNAPSPAATSSLSIGEAITGRVMEMLEQS